MDGWREQVFVNSGYQSKVVVRDSEVKCRVVAKPRGVFYPSPPRVHAGSRHDSPEVLEASPMQKQSKMQIELL